MNIDKDKLKALAEAQPVQIWKRTRGRRPDMKGQRLMYGIEGPEAVSDWEDWGFSGKASEYIAAVSPATVLALLAEIERMEQYAELEAKGSDAAAQDLIRLARENRQLKAENAALRKDADRYRWIRQYTVETLPVAGALNSLDKQIDEAMAREAK